MRRVVFFAACLLSYAGTTLAVPACDMSWRTDRRFSNPGIVLTIGIEDFKRAQPAPPELLEKIGPLLCAAGTEELRVHSVSGDAVFGDPAREAERVIKLRQFIGGREVLLGWVSISLNIRTHEVMSINANFLPDRDVEHEPRLTAGQIRANAARMQQSLNQQLGSTDRQFRFGDGPDPKLLYDIEQVGFAPVRGILVWDLSVIDQESWEWYQVYVDAATGRLVRVMPFAQ